MTRGAQDGGGHRLSSRLTVLLRTVLPASWALLLVVVVLARPPDGLEPARRFLLAALVILLLEWAAVFARLKDVAADEAGLVISRGHRTARVPWSQVAAIRRTWWGKSQFARLELRTPTRFGRSVVFMLRAAPFTPWDEHPSVRTVADRVAAERVR